MSHLALHIALHIALSWSVTSVAVPKTPVTDQLGAGKMQ